jgi:Raf kinase inhibitor-like YbhB/YbcL family protein
MRKTFVAVALLCGCGGSDAAVDAGPAASDLVLTSEAITAGQLMPDQYTCAGADISPPLAWSGGPGAASYAVVFRDRSIGLVHSVIWDIPASVHSLPQNVAKLPMPSVPAGAKQARAFDDMTYGYLGPCPPEVHTYEFEVYAVDVATLPSVTIESTRDQVVPALGQHKLGSGKLEVRSD